MENSLSFLLAFLGESKDVLLWAALGGLGGLVFSLLLLIFLYRAMVRRAWPSPQRWGVWNRRGLGVFWILTIPLSAGCGGGVWGLGHGVKRAIVSKNVLERSTVDPLNPVVAQLGVFFDTYNTGGGLPPDQWESLVQDYLEHRKLVDLDATEKNVSELKEDGLEAFEKLIKEELQRRLGESGIATLATGFLQDGTMWLAEGEAEELVGYIQDVLKNVKERVPNAGQGVTVNEVSTSVVKVHLKPHILRGVKKIVRIQLLLIFAPLIAALLVPPLLLALFGRWKNKQTLEENTTPG